MFSCGVDMGRHVGQEEYKRQVLQALRERVPAPELVDRMEKTWQAAYSANNPSARSWKGMQAHVELLVGILIGKPGVMEIPAEQNAITNLIQSVLAAKMDEGHNKPSIPVQ